MYSRKQMVDLCFDMTTKLVNDGDQTTLPILAAGAFTCEIFVNSGCDTEYFVTLEQTMRHVWSVSRTGNSPYDDDTLNSLELTIGKLQRYIAYISDITDGGLDHA